MIIQSQTLFEKKEDTEEKPYMYIGSVLVWIYYINYGPEAANRQGVSARPIMEKKIPTRNSYIHLNNFDIKTPIIRSGYFHCALNGAA